MIQLPPASSTPVVAEVRPLTDVSTSSLIHTLWGSDNGDKMISIFTCESGMKQWDRSGNLLTSSTSDIGIAQIHIGSSTDWLSESKGMGLDITDPRDNISMAFYIWNKQGFGAWTCAKKVGVI